MEPPGSLPLANPAQVEAGSAQHLDRPVEPGTHHDQVVDSHDPVRMDRAGGGLSTRAAGLEPVEIGGFHAENRPGHDSAAPIATEQPDTHGTDLYGVAVDLEPGTAPGVRLIDDKQLTDAERHLRASRPCP